MATLTVGAGMEFATLSSAIAASSDGDVIQVQAGTYANDFAQINDNITIEGVGGMVVLAATEDIPNSKGILVTNANVTLDNIEFTGATAEGVSNAAGVRYESGNLTINNCYFLDNDNGLLGGADATGNITITNSQFSGNGYGDGTTHDLYVGEINSLTVTNSTFDDAVVGHEIKSRALNDTITGNVIADGPDGTGSYDIDLPNGGNAVISNNIIEKGPNASNSPIISYGEEDSVDPGAPWAGSALTISNNTILNDLSTGASLLVNDDPNVTATVTDNATYGLPAGSSAVNGPATVSGDTVLASEPDLTITQPWTAANPLPTATDTLVLYLSEDEYDGNAAFTVTVDGVAISVPQDVVASHAAGATQMFAFTGNWGTGAHSVGVTFTNDAWGGSAALDRNLYVDGIAYDGSSYLNDTAALTTDGTSSFFVEGQTAWQQPAPTPGGDTLVLTLSEDAYQGDAQFSATIDGVSLGGAQSVTASHGAGQTETFTFTGSWGSGPHDVTVSFLNDLWGYSAANDRNLYVDNVSYDGQSVANGSAALYTDSTAAFAVGNTASVAATPGPPPPQDTLVVTVSEDAYNGDAQFNVTLDGTQLGGTETATASNANGQTESFTFTGIFGSGAHDVGVNFINDAYGGDPTQDRNLYVDSVTYDGKLAADADTPLYSNGTDNVIVNNGLTPPPDDSLVLDISEDAWQGDAMFAVTVDGQRTGSVMTATASHSDGDTTAFDFQGVWGAGPHTIGVTFLNDAWGGSATTDRNLYVDGVSYDGTVDPQGSGAQYSNGTLYFQVNGSQPGELVPTPA